MLAVHPLTGFIFRSHFMATNILTKIFGSRNDRLLKTYRKPVAQINGLEAVLEKLSDEDLKDKTHAFKARIQSGETLEVRLPGGAVARAAGPGQLKLLAELLRHLA